MEDESPYYRDLYEQCQRVYAENELLKDILLGAELKVKVGITERKMILTELLTKHDFTFISPYQESANALNHRNDKEALTPEEDAWIDVKKFDLSASDEKKESDSDSVPRFYKKDLTALLDEKNVIKQQLDSAQEEIEGWKRAAKESESKVVKLELELATALSKLQAIAEAESDAIKVTPGGQNFKPRIYNEAVDFYVTAVEAVDFCKQFEKFVFAIQLTWSDDRRFQIYRGYGEFFTFQHTLLLLFPEEAGKTKSSERIIPTLPTADSILAIFGATNRRGLVESRLQLISDYCTTMLLQLPQKISRSSYVKDYFKARPGDQQLETLGKNDLELSVYPLMPEGQTLDIYVAIAKFDPEDTDTKIPMSSGDRIQVVTKTDESWWYVVNNDTNKCGYVPADFLKRFNEAGVPRSRTITNDVMGFAASPLPVIYHSTKISNEALPLYKYISVSSYETDDDRQISFPDGAVMTILEKSEDGWWFATYNGKEGWVPSSYLEPHNHTEDHTKSLSLMAQPEVSLFIGQKYTTTHSYTAQAEDEITLPSQVEVDVLEKSLNGWWKVSYKKTQGYVPAVILEPAFCDDQSINDHQLPINVFSHSISGIKQPPPRRKFLTERRRGVTFLEPVEETEEEDRRLSSVPSWFKKKSQKGNKEDRRKSENPSRANEKEEYIEYLDISI